MAIHRKFQFSLSVQFNLSSKVMKMENMYAIGIRKVLAHVTINFLLRPERVSERSERLTSVGVVGLTSVAPLLGRWLPWRCQV